MKLQRVIAGLMLLTLTVAVRGQETCTPKPLPYSEDFNLGFIHDNGYWGQFYDLTNQEEVNCWTVCWLHAWGWRSLMALYGEQNRKMMQLRTVIFNQVTRTSGYIPYAVTPQMAAAPRRLQFKASYVANHWLSLTTLHLADGALLALGYVTDEEDCINTYVPFDTIHVMADWEENESIQTFDIDLGRSFDTFPQPWRIVFRPELQDTLDDIIILVDDIRISNEVPTHHCTEEYTDTVCIGTGYHRHGFHIPPEQTFALGTRHYNYVDSTGCLVSLHLTVTGNNTTVVVDTVPCGQPSRYAPDTVLDTGIHYFHFSNSHGCDSLVVLTIQQAWVMHLYDTIQEGDTLLFEGRRLTTGGVYTHDTVTADGCDSLVLMHLHCVPLPPVNTDTLAFWFPNVFTPGLDGNNRFGCIASCEVTEFELYIYNRMGLLVYHTQDIHAPWDGTRQGQPLPQGAYVYTYRLRTPDRMVHQGTGTVTLLR